MELKRINKNYYTLHLINTTKFKTVLVKVVFSSKIKEEELAIRNMLINNLLFSSKNYKTAREMAIKKEELFSAELYSRNYRRGKAIITEVNLVTVHDKFSEKGIINESIKFLFDVLTNPNVENNMFDKSAFKINYENLKTAIISEKEDPNFVCYSKFKELIGKDKIFTTSIMGTEEMLNKITRDNLYTYYKNFFKNNKIDIFVIGDINNQQIENQISSCFNPKSNISNFPEASSSYEKEFNEKSEESKFNQSKLIMGASIKKLTNHEKLYEGIIYNIILGNSPNSKLFQNVREKNSFAYSISSSINRLDGMFVIHAGISLKNYEKTKEEILKQIENMKKGKFTKKEVKDAKEVVLSVIKEVEDFPRAILDHYFNHLYLGNETLKVQKEEIKKVTKEDIIKLAKKINIDTIFLLKEDGNEEISN